MATINVNNVIILVNLVLPFKLCNYRELRNGVFVLKCFHSLTTLS